MQKPALQKRKPTAVEKPAARKEVTAPKAETRNDPEPGTGGMGTSGYIAIMAVGAIGIGALIWLKSRWGLHIT